MAREVGCGICEFASVKIELRSQDDPKENELIEQALSHFALIAIVPDEAEYLELKPMPNRRTQWRSKAGEWEKTGVAP